MERLLDVEPAGRGTQAEAERVALGLTRRGRGSRAFKTCAASPWHLQAGFAGSCPWGRQEKWWQKILAPNPVDILEWRLWTCWHPECHTVVLEKTLEVPLECKEVKPINPKGDQPWIFIGRTDTEAEAPILWPPDEKSQLFGKDPDSGKDWGQEEKGTTEDEMAGWHYRLNEHEFEQTLGKSERQGSLVCCSPLVAKNQTQLSNWAKNVTKL